MDKDIYKKLRPPLPTADYDLCKCIGRPSVVLQSTLNYNPIVCANCNLEVNLNQLTLTPNIIEEIVDWRNFHDCFYRLWLDSKEFEIWAKEQLSSVDSPVTQRGLIIVDKISGTIDCFYWWFVDNLSPDYVPIKNCPKCNKDLKKRKNNFNVDTFVCADCKIIIGV